jgi:hypothetical protein
LLCINNGLWKNAKNCRNFYTRKRCITCYVSYHINGSTLLLFFMDMKLAFALFFIQIVYKVLTPFTVKTINNPIVITNLFVALFHLVTIYTMIKTDTLHFDFLR